MFGSVLGSVFDSVLGKQSLLETLSKQRFVNSDSWRKPNVKEPFERIFFTLEYSKRNV